MCRLIVSEIVTSPCMTSRVEIIGEHKKIQYLKYIPSHKTISEMKIHTLDILLQIKCLFSEKWAAVADICRCLHNFNGVLQVCCLLSCKPMDRLQL